MGERPSVPHHLVGQKATGPRGRVATQPPHDPRELPAARAAGDVASVPSISAALANLGIDPSLLAAFDLLQRNLKAEINLGMNGAVGAQDSVELTLERRKVRQLETVARARLITAVVSLAASMAILAVTWIVVKTARELFSEDVPAAVAEAVETKADPIERRVASTESQVDELAGDVADVGRKVDALARAVSQLAAALEEDDDPPPRRRTR